MQKVKNYMLAYKKYVKDQKENIEAVKKNDDYSESLKERKIAEINNAIATRKAEYQKDINEVIDNKINLAKKSKPDTSSEAYQAAVANIFTKVQLMGASLNEKVLAEILEPAIEKKDNSTISAVKSFIEGINSFPGGDSRKRELLLSIPEITNNIGILDTARVEINRTFNDNNFVNGMMSEVAMQYLEQSGIFDL